MIPLDSALHFSTQYHSLKKLEGIQESFKNAQLVLAIILATGIVIAAYGFHSGTLNHLPSNYFFDIGASTCAVGILGFAVTLIAKKYFSNQQTKLTKYLSVEKCFEIALSEPYQLNRLTTYLRENDLVYHFLNCFAIHINEAKQSDLTNDTKLLAEEICQHFFIDLAQRPFSIPQKSLECLFSLFNDRQKKSAKETFTTCLDAHFRSVYSPINTKSSLVAISSAKGFYNFIAYLAGEKRVKSAFETSENELEDHYRLFSKKDKKVLYLLETEENKKMISDFLAFWKKIDRAVEDMLQKN